MNNLNNYLYHLYLGKSPADEPCAQLGQPNFYEQSCAELEALRNQLKRQFPHATCSIRLSCQDYDFGEYQTLVAVFNPQNEQEVNHAYEMEKNFPKNWDELALEELKSKGFEVKR